MTLKCTNFVVQLLSYEAESLQRDAICWEEKNVTVYLQGIELELARMKVLGVRRQGGRV